MRKLIVIILVVLCCQVKAQTPYVKIETNTTFGFSSTDPFKFSTRQINTGESYRLNMSTFNTQLLAINFGVSFGVKLKSNNKVEFGISGGEAKSGNVLFYEELIDEESSLYAVNERETYSNEGFIQLRALYYKSLINTNFNFIGGLQLGIKTSGSNHPNKSISKASEKIDIETSLYNYKGKNLYAVFGLEHKLHFKKTYLFDVSVFTNLAITNNTFTHQQIIIEEKVDQTTFKKHLHNSYNNGSGILFQLSRTFNLKGEL